MSGGLACVNGGLAVTWVAAAWHNPTQFPHAAMIYCMSRSAASRWRKGTPVDYDVSVTRLSDGDGWDDRVPPEPRSRLRVLAVMGAVVVGCGVAAVFVSSMPDDEVTAPEPDDAAIIVFPDDPTSGGSWPSSTPTRQATYGSATTTVADVPATDEITTTTTTTSEPEPTTTTTTEPTSSSATTTGSPSDEPGPSGQPSSPNPTTTTTTTTTTTEPDDNCPWWWIFC